MEFFQTRKTYRIAPIYIILFVFVVAGALIAVYFAATIRADRKEKALENRVSQLENILGAAAETPNPSAISTPGTENTSF